MQVEQRKSILRFRLALPGSIPKLCKFGRDIGRR
jgi:hypothetical protein